MVHRITDSIRNTSRIHLRVREIKSKNNACIWWDFQWSKSHRCYCNLLPNKFQRAILKSISPLMLIAIVSILRSILIRIGIRKSNTWRIRLHRCCNRDHISRIFGYLYCQNIPHCKFICKGNQYYPKIKIQRTSYTEYYSVLNIHNK